jgi:hypothetical protein
VWQRNQEPFGSSPVVGAFVASRREYRVASRRAARTGGFAAPAFAGCAFVEGSVYYLRAGTCVVSIHLLPGYVAAAGTASRRRRGPVALRPRLSPGMPLSRDGATDLGCGTVAVKHPAAAECLISRAAGRTRTRDPGIMRNGASPALR